MQKLKTFQVSIQYSGQPFEFSVNQRDGDDSISYDVFYNGAFLVSLPPKGDILFKSDTSVPGNITTDALVEAVQKVI
jgi:hypothetical protein